MELKKTGLYDMHVSAGGKMVSFAGYSLPIQYSSILDEHRRVRETVGVFDVSHMGEVVIKGAAALDMVNKITINDAGALQVNQAQYSAMCYPDGGIVDDLIVYRREDHYLLVINASNVEKDFKWMLENKIDGCEIENISDSITQIAVQGKDAEKTLQQLTNVDLPAIEFYWFEEGVLAGEDMIISRTGYTGEPGFELYFDRGASEKVWQAVFAAGAPYQIEPIGLGARDSLRLEKKYCLYGNDISAEINPYEAGMGWITKLDKGDFVGRQALQKVKSEGHTRRLIGFIVDGRIIPRNGYEVFSGDQKIGFVTSGAFSPVMEKNIGLAMVDKPHDKIGATVRIVARGREAEATFVKTPFL